MESGDVESHGGLDVVPRIAVSALEPRDHSGVELQTGDRLGGLYDFVGTEDAFDVRDTEMTNEGHAFTNSRTGSERRAGAGRLTAYTMRLLPMTGESTRSTARIERGCLTMSHSRNFL